MKASHFHRNGGWVGVILMLFSYCLRLVLAVTDMAMGKEIMTFSSIHENLSKQLQLSFNPITQLLVSRIFYMQGPIKFHYTWNKKTLNVLINSQKPTTKQTWQDYG